jgi:phospholipid N-methyltransferase
LASNEVSAFEMKTWFDWQSISTVYEYVSATGVSTKKVSSARITVTALEMFVGQSLQRSKKILL